MKSDTKFHAKLLESNVYTLYHSGMRIQINQWGNSLAFRIPKTIAEHLKLGCKTEMEVEVKGNSLVLSKPQYCLEELIADITPGNIHPETDTGNPVGNELW